MPAESVWIDVEGKHACRLEGRWQTGDVHNGARSDLVAVLCHPHPKLGGNMNCNVVTSMQDGLTRWGVSSLRFNFRGVGRSSGGKTWGGSHEAEDVHAAIAFAMAKGGSQRRVLLLGYSFGAAVSTSVAATAELAGLVLVAPPWGWLSSMVLGKHQNSLPALRERPLPVLAVIGDEDNYTSVSRFESKLDLIGRPVRRVVVPGVDHFFVGRESAVVDAVVAWIHEEVAQGQQKVYT